MQEILEALADIEIGHFFRDEEIKAMIERKLG